MKKILIVLMLLVGSIVLVACDELEDSAEVEAETEQENADKVEKEKAKADAKEAKKEDEDEVPEVAEHDDLEFGEFTMEKIKTEVNDNELTFNFNWINQSGKDKLPFTAAGYIDVYQGDDLLDETSGSYDVGNKIGILFTNALGGSHKVTLTYNLESDEPIKIRIGATHEDDNTKKEIVIEDLD